MERIAMPFRSVLIFAQRFCTSCRRSLVLRALKNGRCQEDSAFRNSNQAETFSAAAALVAAEFEIKGSQGSG